KRARIANLKVEIFKPAIDTRYDESKVVSHDASSIPSTPIDNSQTILLMAQDVDVVGIDEAQFFDGEIIHVCETLALKGVRVIVAGLDMDY
ncbi:thymidine kinase, partial [Acinetobacter baumannii]